MKLFFGRMGVLVSVVSMAAAQCFALDTGTMKSDGDEGIYTGGYSQGAPLAGNAEKSYLPSGGTDRRKVESLLGSGALSLGTEPSGKAWAPKDGTAAQTEPQKMPKILLKAEPGDGLASLSWRVSGLQSRTGEQTFKYTVYYGTESGRYDKKINVGDVGEYTLRSLKNNQVYYVKVQGNTRFQEETETEEPQRSEMNFFSPEVRIIPLAAEEQGSPLEKTFAGKTTTLQDKQEYVPIRRDIKQFGYDFFRNSLTNALPLENVPVGPDYVIGPGDSLRIDLWGSVQGHYDVRVDRNGEITIPKVGAVKVWGTSYGQAREVIDKAVSRYFKGYELNVTLGKLRTIQVFVVGEVEAPGTYTVNPLATVINALAISGGPSKNGSLRTIRVSRGGKVVEEIDLYDMFLNGDRNRDVRLENGDTIFVPVIGPVVAVAGEVKRPAIYELKGDTTLYGTLQMAGGMTALGDAGRVQVERVEGNSTRVVLDYEPESGLLAEKLGSAQIKDRDMVKVFPVYSALRQVVSLRGHVVRPGEYQFRKGMRVSDVIPSFEALLPDSYLVSAEITRLVRPDFHKETINVNLQEALSGNERENMPLVEQDTIKVFSRGEMEDKPLVSINGYVVNPGTYDFFPRMTIRDLVAAAGSLKRNAYPDHAELTRINIKGTKASASRIDIDLKKAFSGDEQHNLALQPDDVLIVRGVSEWLESSDRFVMLKGEVAFPGTYSITKGERLSSVISRAGGYTDKAYLNGVRFFRKSVQKDQQKRMDEILQRSEQDILKKQGELASVAASREELEATKAALEGLQKGLEKLKTLKAEGRVVIRLADLNTFTGSTYDMELQGGDSLDIPPTPAVVNVLGQVYNQSALVYQPGGKLSYYLQKVGGATRDAEEDEMYIIRADGSVVSNQQSTFGFRWDDELRSWSFGGFASTQLLPGDTLVVPQKIERTAWLREIKDITQILANVALTAGTVLIGIK
jgi:protein involved in polysaccharide export with SLBB domain